jgi:hypothetical protein
MELDNARGIAKNLLLEILKTQPALLSDKTGVHTGNAAGLAKFCEEFIEEYAKYLTARNRSDS